MKFNKTLDDLKLYEAGKPIELVVREYGIDAKDVIKMASNENPYGTPPSVVKRVADLAKNMYLYPDDSMYRLKKGLSQKFGVDEKNIAIGAGSDQVIEFAIRAKANENSKVLMAKTTFAMYEIYSKQVGASILRTPSDSHNLDEFRTLYKEHKDSISIIFLCLPNNPLGECLDRDDVYLFLDEIDKDVLVVVDGAYQEYASYKDPKKAIIPKDIIQKYSNVLYLGTFSKAYSLGGMRVGYGIAQENIVQALLKMRPPFNITVLTLEAAVGALEEEEFVNQSISKNFEQMKRFEDFAIKNNIKFIESYTNFITFLIPFERSSKEISNALLKKGIIVRDLTSYCVNAIRITIGQDWQNDKFFNIFGEVYSTYSLGN